MLDDEDEHKEIA
jgi:hypothetical protein